MRAYYLDIDRLLDETSELHEENIFYAVGQFEIDKLLESTRDW
jgi:hypothetical protein